MKTSILVSICIFVLVNGDERIAGGSVTTINEYPFVVSLLTNNGEGTYTQACGGSILTRNAILSAASCFYSGTTLNPVSWWRARIGSSFSNSVGEMYVISTITAHPDFSPTTLVNDLAILRTRLDITLQANVTEVARIAGSAYTFTQNQVVRAVGFGVTSNINPTLSAELRAVQIWAIDQQTCTNRYNEVAFTVTTDMVCAGWLDVGIRGQCQGDTGSPLLDNEGAVVGVFSWAQGCAQGRYPGINTRVASYTQWIVATALAAQ